MKNLEGRKLWHTSKRALDYSEKTLVMGILNVTPDSFSDGGDFYNFDKALKHSEKLIEDGADIIDIGGESTRPDSKEVDVDVEIKRVVPIIEGIRKRFDVPISIDTYKGKVADEAIEAGAEIINDISGLRFDGRICEIALERKTGLVLMNLRGQFDTMHTQDPETDIVSKVCDGLEWSIGKAKSCGIRHDQLCLDVGIGFSKTQKQNLELIAKLEVLRNKFSEYPFLLGVSRKSFIGGITGQPVSDQRLIGSLAANVIAVWNGANIVRVHDVRSTVESLLVADAIRLEK